MKAREAAAASLGRARTARLLEIAHAKRAESEQRTADIAEVSRILGGDGALGPDTPDRERKADAYFDGVLAPALEDLQPDQQTDAILDYSTRIGVLPAAVRKRLIGDFASEDVARQASAAATIARLEETDPRLIEGVAPTLVAEARDLHILVDLGVEPARAVAMTGDERRVFLPDDDGGEIGGPEDAGGEDARHQPADDGPRVDVEGSSQKGKTPTQPGTSLGADDRAKGDLEPAAGEARPEEVEIAMGERRPKPLHPEAKAEIERMQRKPEEVFEIRMEQSRIWAIRNNWPATFNIEENPNELAKSYEPKDLKRGAEAVEKYDETIERQAKAQGVDPNLIRAVMFVENSDYAQVPWERLEKIGEAMGIFKSILPMNIRPDVWGGIGGVNGEEFGDAEQNIRAGIGLIRAITDRIKTPTAAKVATIWNATGRETVSDFGAKVQGALDNKLWLRATETPQR